MKKQRLDLIDKTDDYKEQVKDNEKLQHEITHLTSYFKDGQKQITQLKKTIEEMKTKEGNLNEQIERLEH